MSASTAQQQMHMSEAMSCAWAMSSLLCMFNLHLRPLVLLHAATMPIIA